MASTIELLAWIDAFRPTSAEGDWRVLDAYLQALPAHELGIEAVPALLRVFERFPRHDGYGVLWAILHTIEAIAGHEPIVVEHVRRTPTEMGITMLNRMLGAGLARVGAVELAPLVKTLAARAPIVDYTIELAQLAAPGTTYPRAVADQAVGSPVHAAGDLHAPARDAHAIVADLARFAPALADEVDWAPLLALLAELEAAAPPLDVAIDALLATLDRFRAYPGFAAFWPIVTAIERTPDGARAIVASLQRTRTDAGVTLLLRALAAGITHAGDVELAPLAASLLPAAPHTH